ncbi:DUF4325 domain-containing protein [Apilactobacillus sp. TMW 2.2459]|uniref:STAS-like domain-containing protein n=1 Tax=Apilactobacillus xinyiensis TaxID=2841032 RepID=UPI00200DCE38|nr:DUF4325 domain-containing protein [Apilactobacillus xinyiensis]MCL0312814.1 DUF4325 domain-containing protein [Apilactobacillus xinyiensis]
MNREKVNVSDVIQSKTAVSSDQGRKLFKKLSANINNKVFTDVYFNNIEILTTAFLNTSIGNLYGTVDSKTLNEYVALKTDGLPKSRADKIKLVMKNLKNRLSTHETNIEIFGEDEETTL